MTKPDLSAALALNTAEDCLRLYREWASSYDADFAANMEYHLPGHVAAAFMATNAGGPVLDVGAGTGLLAQSLRDMGFAGDIDGLDLSPEMLARAAEKGVYRNLHRADITRPVPIAGGYRGIVSSGTFTAGHVGPEAFPPLLDLAARGAQFALSVNLRVWHARGFGAALDALAHRITLPQMIEVAVYGPAATRLDPDHADDRAAIVLFRAI